MYYEINENRQRQAKAMWSFSDYIMGSTTEDYKKAVDGVYALTENISEKNKEYALQLADKYAKKLAEYYNKSAEIELRCPSVMISGAGNFPVRKKEKQNAARAKNEEFYNYIQGLKGKIKNLDFVSDVIKSGDAEAVEKLQQKVDDLTKLQETMKKANAHYRKNGNLDTFADFTEEEKRACYYRIEKGFSWEKMPFPSYELTNNNAKIKNTMQRLEQLKKVKTQDTSEKEFDLFKVIENTELMRIQLIFDGKPADNIRNILKSNGFKWAPSQNAWQRQLTPNAQYATKKVIEHLKREVQ
jgi:hypothetical protein